MDDIITGTPNSLSAASLRPTATPSVKPPLVSNDGEWSTWNIITIVLIVVVLALLGLNIFSYLAKGTDVIGDFLARFSSHVPETAAKVIDTSVVGTQVAADVAAGIVATATVTVVDTAAPDVGVARNVAGVVDGMLGGCCRC